MEHVSVDPSKLVDLEIDVGSRFGSSNQNDLFEHDQDWVRRICDQIQRYRFASIRLPRKYIKLYQMLLQPEAYPGFVSDGKVLHEYLINGCASVEGLPEDLVNLCKSWISVSEQICRPVTEHLSSLFKRPLFRSAPSSNRHTEGMLRISFNSSAGRHIDNGYVTFMGTGNTRGALQFGFIQPEGKLNQESHVEGGETFTPCEEFFGPREFDDSENIHFILFVGSKLATPLTEEFKPLLHRVDYKSDNVARINAIYFLRNYSASDQDSSSTELDIFAFNKGILNAKSFLNRNVQEIAKIETSSADGIDAQSILTTKGDEGVDENAEPTFDWNSDWLGVPFD